MSIRITVDNNFFDNYEHYGDENVKQAIKNAFINKRISFYPSLQLVQELASLYKIIKRNHLLPKYSSLFLEIIGYRCFNDWSLIIRSELGIINNQPIFLPKLQVVQLIELFKNLAIGRIHKDVKNALFDMAANKEKRYKFAKEDQTKLFDNMKKLRIKAPKMNFDNFFNWDTIVRIRKDLIRSLFERVKKPITERKVDEILNNAAAYPYFYTSQRVFMATYYRHNVLKRRVDEGDDYDQYYLIYLTKLDYLISNDRGLRELSEFVFGKNNGKVITFSEFVKLIKE